MRSKAASISVALNGSGFSALTMLTSLIESQSCGLTLAPASGSIRPELAGFLSNHNVMNFFSNLFSSGPFMPHGHCYFWTTSLISLHVIADALIVLAYYSIPITLVYFVRKRKDLKFHWMFVCFAVFIVACGTTHLMEIWNIWRPYYWLSGGIKAITALASVPTAVLLVNLVPR